MRMQATRLRHARNLIDHDPWSFSWLTGEEPDPRSPVVTRVYTHNPNFPRYLHAILYLLGLPFTWHTLILGAIGTTLSMYMAWRACREQPVVPIAQSIDSVQFLAWTANTYRIWTYPLIWGAILAARGPWRAWQAGVLAFVLFQLEYGLAMILSLALGLLALRFGLRDRLRMLGGFGVGAALSLALFGMQVLTYYGGLEATRQELMATVVRRGGFDTAALAPTRQAAASSLIPYRWILVEQFDALEPALAPLGGFGAWLLRSFGLVEITFLILIAFYSETVVLLVLAGIGLTLWNRSSPPAAYLAPILGGALVTILTLWVYFASAYLASALPFPGIVVWLSVGVVAQRLEGWSGRPRLTAALTLAPLAIASVTMLRMPFPGEVFTIIEREYAGRAFSTPDYWFVYALTGGRTHGSGVGQPTRDLLESLATFRDPDGRLAWTCIDVSQGLKAIANGPGYTILELSPPPPR